MKFCRTEFQQQPPYLKSSRSGRNFFACMLAISLTLHVVSSIVMLSSRTASMNASPITYIDLNQVMKFHEQLEQTPVAEQKLKEVVQSQTPEKSEPPPVESISETEKLQRDVQQSLEESRSNPLALQGRSIGLGLSSGYFSSIAEGESLRSDIKEYYLTLLRDINEKWWLNKETHGRAGGAIINIVVARNGEIVLKKLIRRSGNAAFDRAMIKVLEDASPLPPLPESYDQDFFSVPLKFIGPLNFFS